MNLRMLGLAFGLSALMFAVIPSVISLLRPTPPILVAAFKGQLALVRWEMTKGASANAADSAGRSALMQAASGGQPGVVMMLLEYRADPNRKDGWGDTALHRLARGESSPSRVTCAELLVRAGADVNAAGRHGKTPLMEAAEKGNVPLVRLFLNSDAAAHLRDDRGNRAADLATGGARELLQAR